MNIEFTKMHGLGNDFAIIDTHSNSYNFTSADIRAMSHRRLGIGFDQMLLIEKVNDARDCATVRIFNADGQEAEQCGNGVRCVAKYLVEKKLCDREEFCLQTKGGLLAVKVCKNGTILVNMGKPRFSPAEIPFRADSMKQTYELNLKTGRVEFVVVNIGNPHAVMVVKDLKQTDIPQTGKILSQHESFPEGVNVGFMQIITPQQIELKVFERGSGETMACGSGACAAVVAGRQLGLLAERVTVRQPGGELSVEWQGISSSIMMQGPAEFVYEGRWFKFA